ncbi:MAG: DUF3298 domain-containing protein [Oscillospiraceae bacterium]|nr:DUF3298 domain-containing protein [Oscillospiraceae bacterium]
MRESVYGNRQLAAAKAAYESVSMPEFQVARLRETVSRAKRDSKRRAGLRGQLVGLAAAIALFIALPNASPAVASAISGIPMLGSVARLVTFRSYAYEDERHSAKIETPQLIVDDAGGALASTADGINAEIARVTEEMTALFKASLEQEGYGDMLVSSEVVATTEEYFTLRLICYQANASGYEQDRYYTIDLRTGEWLRLADLFADGADYVSPISEEIKRQMREQMAADENAAYWLDSDEPSWDFTAIDPDAEFYLDENGEVVVSFDKGEVAPYYMGVCTFTIPSEALASIRK